MRAVVTGSVVVAALLFATPAFSQTAVAGIVKDASGAILPGVSVEASSPALIEKSRGVVTDGTGLVPASLHPQRREINPLTPGSFGAPHGGRRPSSASP